MECAHIRYSDARYDKNNPGVGARPDDRFTIPLSSYWHRLGAHSQHNHGNEREWWEQRGIDPCKVALALWEVSGDLDAGERIVNEARHVAQQSTVTQLR